MMHLSVRPISARRAFAPIGLAAALATSLAGCGSGSGGDDAPPSTTSAEAPDTTRTVYASPSAVTAGRDFPEAPAPLHEPLPLPPDPFSFDREVTPSSAEFPKTVSPPALPDLPIPPDPIELPPPSQAKSEAEAVIDGIVGGVRQSMGAFATGAAEGVRGEVDQTVGEVRSEFEQAIGGVKGEVQQVGDELRGEFEATIGEVKGQVNQKVEGAKEGVRQGVRQAVGTVQGKVSNEAQRAKDEIKQSAQELRGQLFNDLLGGSPTTPAPAPAEPKP